MKSGGEAVLESSHGVAADLSSSRRLVRDKATLSVDEEFANLTGSRMEYRGFLSDPQALRRFKSPEGNVLPFCSDTMDLKRLRAESAEKPAVVWVPVIPPSLQEFHVLQKFEGIVRSVQGDSFVARLVDKTNANCEEEAEIPLAEVMPGDQDLVKPGAVFYWVMGYRREEYGQVYRFSMIRFQRLPGWSRGEIERTKEAAAIFLSFLDLERANHPA
ncbi:MAG: hypothetical protein KGJ88_03625 [Verrucomicrobiota bacterium]|nr:hypothetical protein [Verrucomicrobiota bacterium]